MKRKPISLALAVMSFLTLGASSAFVITKAAISPYEAVQAAASTSSVDSRFHVATTSNPWTYTDYQGSYYSSIDLSSSGESLLQSLSSLTNSQYKSESYDGLKNGLPAVCKFANGQEGMVGFYNRQKLPSKWDNQATWNREHVWPDSRGAGKSGPGSNPFIIMPASVKINSSRGNNFFGTSSKTWDPGQYDTQFRGAAARSILYAAMQYKSTLRLSENANDSSSNNTMGVKSLLLKWNLEYRPDADEMYRNNLTAQRYGARNPFIDYPYLATNIWGGGSGGGSSSSSSSSSGGDTPIPQGDTYKQITNVSELTAGKEIVIGGLGNDGKTVYALSGEILKDSTPWYLEAQNLGDVYGNGSFKTVLNPTRWTVGKNSDSFTFENDEAGFLKGYVSESHYSVGLTKKPGTASSPVGSNDWNLTFASDGSATFLSPSGTYLNFVESTKYIEFAGNKAAGKIYLFEKEEEKSAFETAEDFATRFASGMGEVCTLEQQNSDTPSAALLEKWQSFATEAETFSEDVLTLLRDENSESAAIANFVALYSHICFKYTDMLNSHGGDFLLLFGSSTVINARMRIGKETNALLWTGLGVSLSAIACTAVLAVVKKKKLKSIR